MTAIGVDEKRFSNPTPTPRTVYTTQIVDLDRHRVLDVIEGRSREVLGGGRRPRVTTGAPRSAWRRQIWQPGYTDSPTMATTGGASSDVSASSGMLTPPHEHGAANHDSSRNDSLTTVK